MKQFAFSVFTLFFISLISVASAPLSQKLPYSKHLKFIENKGQWENFVTHKLDIPNGKVFLQKNQLTYTLYKQHEYSELTEKRHDGLLKNTDSLSLHSFNVRFLNANPNPIIQGNSAYTEHYNYFLGNDKTKWTSNVKAFSEIVYTNIYKNIDLKIYEKSNTLKYEFIVSPRGNPNQIRLAYDGLDDLFIRDGRLFLKTSVGTIQEKRPYVYQIINDQKVRVACDFEIINNKEVFFKLKGHYNKRENLIIDPELVFSTYSGSLTDNWGSTACYDDEGNVYTSGAVFNDVINGFPTTIGAYKRTFNNNEYGLTDIGILKFNTTGTELLYGTYIGGTDTDVAVSMIVNNQNELVVLGITGSENFPILTNSYDKIFGKGTSVLGGVNGFCNFEPMIGGSDFVNGSDLIIFKLNENGSNLTGSTYLGGSGNDGITYGQSTLCRNYGDQQRGDIIIDDNDNIYIASTTFSSNFPNSNGFDNSFNGNQDGIVSKLNSSLSSLIWSSYIGGSRQDIALSIQLDREKNVWICGGTTSSNFPIKGNTHQTSQLGNGDGYIAQIKADGSEIIKSTYVGTSNYDQTYFIQLDSQENIYVLGQTTGRYPISQNVYSNNNAGIFIHEFDNDLNETVFSTTIGSKSSSTIKPNISPTAFLVNDCGNILFSGWGGLTNTTYVDYSKYGCSSYSYTGYNGGYTYNMPISKNAFQKTTDGSDFYLMILSKDAKEFLYGSYFGGNQSAEHVDGGTSRFDERGIVYQSVCAGCKGYDDFPQYPPITDSTFYPQENNNDNCNNAVFKLDLTSLKAEIGKLDSCITNGVSFQNLSFGAKDYLWNFGDGNTFFTEAAYTVGHQYDKVGEYTVTLIATDLATCKRKDTAQVTIKIIETFGKKYTDTLCVGEQKMIEVDSLSLDLSYNWNPINKIDKTQGKKAWITGNKSTLYTIEIPNKLNCPRIDSFDIFIPELSTSHIPKIIGNCDKKVPTITFLDEKYENLPYSIKYLWDFGDGQSSIKSSFTHQYPAYDTYSIKLTTNFAHCQWDTSYQITLKEIYIPNIVTPNKDAVNENLIIEGIKNSGSWNLDIYNRWGEAIYKNEDYKNNWSGKSLEDGTYYYLLTAPDETTCKGWIQIIR